MTLYYCDLAADFVDRTGEDSTTNVLTGPGGFTNGITGSGAATALAAGDTLYLKGTADLSKLVKCTVDADKTGTWVIGDAVQNHNDGGGASGDDWVGKLVAISATVMLVQINAASTNYASVAIADGIDNTTRSDTLAGANFTAKACSGIQINGNSGTTGAGFINVIGCDASWTARGGQATLDCNSLAVNAILSNAADYWRIEHLTLTRATGSGFLATNVEVYWTWYHCRSHTNTNSGWSCGVNEHDVANFINCIADSNANGFSLDSDYLTILFCRANGNTDSGFVMAGDFSVVYGCLSYENTNAHGFQDTEDYKWYFNCVGADNGGSGCSVGTNDLIHCWSGCRFTGNGAYGITTGTAHLSDFEDWNVFEGNISGDLNNIARGGGIHSYGDHANHISDPADDGFVNSANDNYNVADGKELDSVEIDLFWDA